MSTKPEWQIRDMELTLQRLRAENERLREGLVNAGRQLAATEDHWQAEIERLRTALHHVRHLCNGASYVGHPVLSDIFQTATEALGRDNCH